MAQGFQIEPVAAVDGCVCVVRLRIYFDITILDDDRRLPVKRWALDQIAAQRGRGNTRSELTRAKLERGWGWKIGGSLYR